MTMVLELPVQELANGGTLDFKGDGVTVIVVLALGNPGQRLAIRFHRAEPLPIGEVSDELEFAQQLFLRARREWTLFNPPRPRSEYGTRLIGRGFSAELAGQANGAANVADGWELWLERPRRHQFNRDELDGVVELVNDLMGKTLGDVLPLAAVKSST